MQANRPIDPKQAKKPANNDMKLDVIYSDNHLLTANKEAGLLAQADKTGDIDLLTLGKDFLKQKYNKPGNVYLGLVHRLDRPVSGIMIFARTSKAAGRLSAQFRAGTPRKQYFALVEGDCCGRGSCVDYLVKEEQNVRIVPASHPKALYAELEWKSLAQKDNLSLLEVTLKTGRPHQIRVQLAHMGFPVLGDLRYGADKEFDGQNIALHCYLLGLEHPVKKTGLQWTAKPPSSWEGRFEDSIDSALNRLQQTKDPSPL